MLLSDTGEPERSVLLSDKTCPSIAPLPLRSNCSPAKMTPLNLGTEASPRILTSSVATNKKLGLTNGGSSVVATLLSCEMKLGLPASSIEPVVRIEMWIGTLSVPALLVSLTLPPLAVLAAGLLRL